MGNHEWWWHYKNEDEMSASDTPRIITVGEHMYVDSKCHTKGCQFLVLQAECDSRQKYAADLDRELTALRERLADAWPEEPPREWLAAMAGSPLLLAASDELQCREIYQALRAVAMGGK